MQHKLVPAHHKLPYSWGLSRIEAVKSLLNVGLEQVELPFGCRLWPFARGGFAAFEEFLGDLVNQPA